MCLMRFERNFLKTATLIVLVWAYPYEMKTNYLKILKMHHFASIDYMLKNIISLTELLKKI